jgi:hypothetical protein
LGWYGKYLEGSVRNPAIAASTAIILSLVYASLALFRFKRGLKTNLLNHIKVYEKLQRDIQKQADKLG